MKWPVEKRTIVIVLLGILVLALINNFVSRRQYDDLTKNISSIYKDRLIPASYIFQMNGLLYQKQLLLQTTSAEAASAKLHEHNAEISRIIEAYEATYLTQVEKEQWQSFRQHLASYNHAEALIVSSAEHAQPSTLQSNFDKVLQSLKHLNETQTSEGMRLEKESKSIINSTIIQAYLEVSLLFILGIIGLMLLTASEKVIYPVSHRYLHN